jgi:hypothetical protein
VQVESVQVSREYASGSVQVGACKWERVSRERASKRVLGVGSVQVGAGGGAPCGRSFDVPHVTRFFKRGPDRTTVEHR